MAQDPIDTVEQSGTASAQTNQSTINVSYNMGKAPNGTVTPNMEPSITEKKADSILEASKPSCDPVPPSSPLNGGIQQTSIIPASTMSPSKVDDDYLYTQKTG